MTWRRIIACRPYLAYLRIASMQLVLALSIPSPALHRILRKPFI
jgi:hypothetical protein